MNTTKRTKEISYFDRIENNRMICQDLEFSFNEFQDTISKLKKKNEKENQKNYVCIKNDFFDFIKQKIEKMQSTFSSIINNYETVFDDISSKNNQISQEKEKITFELNSQFKCDILKLELKHKQIVELQIEEFKKKEDEYVKLIKLLLKSYNGLEYQHNKKVDEILLSFQTQKQKLFNFKARHLFLLNKFDKISKNLNIDNVSPKNEKNKLKLKTLQTGDNTLLDIQNISKISPVNQISHKIAFGFRKGKENIQTKANCQNNVLKNIDKNSESIINNTTISESIENKEVDSELSIFLANHINNYQEESLNISMPKDEGKWDPAYDSEKSEKNSDFIELKKAFEIFENYNLFEGENIGILQKCLENKKINTIDKAMNKELIFQLLKLKQEKPVQKKEKQINLNQKESNDTSLFSQDHDDIPRKKSILLSKKKNSNENQSFKLQKENSFSDSIFIFHDSSFYSPQTSKKIHNNIDDPNLKHVKKEDLINVRSLPVSFRKDINDDVIDECLDEYERVSNKSKQYFEENNIKDDPIYIEENNESFCDHRKYKRNKTIEEDSNDLFSESRRYDQMLKSLKNQIKMDQILHPNKFEKDEESSKFTKVTLIEQKPYKSMKKHAKHSSEVFKSTPTCSFLNNINSNSESKISTNIDAKSLIKKGKMDNECYSQKNLLKKHYNNPSNSFFFSNNFTNNYDIGFLQNIMLFKQNNDGDCDSIKSDPIILTNTYLNPFCEKKKIERNRLSCSPMNRSYPGAKMQNKFVKKILVQPLQNYRANKRTGQKSMESIVNGIKRMKSMNSSKN